MTVTLRMTALAGCPVFHRADSGGALAGNDLPPGKRGLCACGDTGNSGYGRAVESFSGRLSVLFEGDGCFPSADCGFLFPFPDDFQAGSRKKAWLK